MPNPKIMNTFPFLTDHRKRRFQYAARSTNASLRRAYREDASVLSSIDPYHMGNHDRPWLIARIIEAFATDEDTRRRRVNNIVGLEIDEEFFLSFAKHQLLSIDESGEPVWESKTVMRARAAPAVPWPPAQSCEQPSLFDFADEVPEEPIGDIPLCNLHHIKVLYVMRDNQIIVLHFVDQDEKRRYVVESLDIDTGFAAADKQSMPPDVPLDPKIAQPDRDSG